MLGRKDALGAGVTPQTARAAANAASFARPLLGMAALMLLSRNDSYVFLPLILAGCATDWLDGEFARRGGIASTRGRVIDGVCDFLFLACLFAFLAEARAWSPPVWGRLARHWAAANWLPLIALGSSFSVYLVRMCVEMQRGVEPQRSARGHTAGVANYSLAIAGGVELLPGVNLGPWLLEPAIVGVALLNLVSISENVRLMFHRNDGQPTMRS